MSFLRRFAVLPLLVLPGTPGIVVEVARPTGSAVLEGDDFGWSVALTPRTLVVGAPRDDDPATDGGAAYVFDRDAGGPNAWGQVAHLEPSDVLTRDQFFGWSVAIAGDTVVVGFPNDDLGALTAAGSARVFERNRGGPNAWGEAKTLRASDASFTARFGRSVAMAGDRVVVGAPYDEDVGAVYVYERDPLEAGQWNEVEKLVASDALLFDRFGVRVALSGDRILVGADQVSTIPGPGKAYVFDLDGSAWSETAILLPPSLTYETAFGRDVALDGDTIAVGAQRFAPFGGEVFLFQLEAGTWQPSGAFTQVNEPSFGASVALADDTLVVGAYFSPGAGSQTGEIHLYHRGPGGAWSPLGTTTASDSLPGDGFGRDVAIARSTIAVGASGALAGEEAGGAAYVLRLPTRTRAPLSRR